MKFLLTFVFVMLIGGVAAAEPGVKPAKKPDKPMRAMELSTEPFAEFVAPEDSLPRLRFFADGQVSLNDRCPVRRVRLNPRMGASYVNGRPVGFC